MVKILKITLTSTTNNTNLLVVEDTFRLDGAMYKHVDKNGFITGLELHKFTLQTIKLDETTSTEKIKFVVYCLPEDEKLMKVRLLEAMQKHINALDLHITQIDHAFHKFQKKMLNI